MNRKDFEVLCRVLKLSKYRVVHDPKGLPISGKLTGKLNGVTFPEVPSPEWMRHRIAYTLCEAFHLKEDAKVNFLKSAGVSYHEQN